MTLADIATDVITRLDYGVSAATVPPAIYARIKLFINQRHRALLGDARLRSLRMLTTTIVPVANQSSYALPYGCARVQRVIDTTNEYELRARTREWYRERSGNPALHPATAESWIGMDFGACFRRPNAANLYFALDTGATTTAGVTFTVTQIAVGGREETRTGLVLGGTPTTPVLIPNSLGANIVDVLRFSASIPLLGRIVLLDQAAGGTPLAEIGPETSTARYYRVALWPTPSAAGVPTYLVDYEHEIPTLVNDTDEPMLPMDFHDLLCLMARRDEYEFKSDDRLGTLDAPIADRLRQLRSWVGNHDPKKMTALGDESIAGSRLGPWFPAGT